MNNTCFALTFLACLSATAATHAVTVPFTEDFAANSANWQNSDTTAFLTHSASGGPDGSGYASGTFNFQSSTAGGQGPVILRANNTTPAGPASGGSFIGNWIADGVRGISASVRHNAPVPLSYFVRFAGPGGFPGAVAVQFGVVAPNTWTPLEFAINPNSPNFVTFEGQSFASIFSNVGRIQVGVSVPAALAGVNQAYTFDIDNVSIGVPEPSALGLCVIGLMTAASRRRCFAAVH